MIVTDWAKYAPFFTEAEMQCKHTGKCEMDSVFMDMLYDLRKAYGKPMRINSGYRHWSHPVEAKKGHKDGEHTKGRCVDVGIQGAEAMELLSLALQHGFRRIGVNQKGNGRFLHIGIGGDGLPTPALWSY